MTAVLADTGPLYALAFKSDQYHLQARAELERIIAGSQPVIVTFTTIVEGYRLILHGSDARYASRWFDELRDSTEFVNPTEDDYVAAAQRIQRYADQHITLADGVLAIVSQRLGMPVWTYDHHFDVMHRPLALTARRGKIEPYTKPLPANEERQSEVLSPIPYA